MNITNKNKEDVKMLLFLQEKLSLQRIEELQQKLEEFRGESINREYWEEVFYYTYELDAEDEQRILKLYNIEIIEEL
jgi:hypothetical protein